jgi:hypothetical protein
MNAKDFISRIAELAKRYDASMAGIAAKMNQAFPDFNHLQVAVQQQRADQERGFIREDFTRELEKLTETIAEAKAVVPAEIARLKFPLTSSKDMQKQILGELQTNSARLFLSMNPKPVALANEIRAAVDLGRMDAAWLLMDAVKSRIPKDSILDPEEKALQDAISSVQMPVTGLSELEGEVVAFADVSRLAGDAMRQIAGGVNKLFLPDVMSEDEISDASKLPNYSVFETIQAKRRKQAAA